MRLLPSTLTGPCTLLIAAFSAPSPPQPRSQGQAERFLIHLAEDVKQVSLGPRTFR